MKLYIDQLEILEISATVIEDVDTQVKQYLEGVGELKLSGRHTGKRGRTRGRKRGERERGGERKEKEREH